MPEGAGQEAFAFEARLGEVLLKLKATDVEDLVYCAASKPVDCENWVALTRMNLESKHSQLVIWWDTMFATTRSAYEQYLQLSPLQRSGIRPDLSGFNVTCHQVERYMIRHVTKPCPGTSRTPCCAQTSCSRPWWTPGPGRSRTGRKRYKAW